MFAKVIVILVVALGSLVALLADAKSIQVKNIKDDVQAAIDQITNTTKLASEAGGEIYQKWTAYCEEGEALHKSTEKKLADRRVTLHQVVEEYRKQADEEGVDISTCTTTWSTNLEKVIETGLEVVKAWLIGCTNKHFKMWEQVLGSIMAAEKTLEGITLDASLCENDECFEEVLTRLRKLEGVADAAKEMADSEVVSLVADAKEAIYNSTLRIDYMFKEMDQTNAVFVLCAKDKLGH